MWQKKLLTSFKLSLTGTCLFIIYYKKKYPDHSVGQKTCKNCGKGKYSSKGASSCTKCSPGTYASSSKASSCKTCAYGKYQVQILTFITLYLAIRANVL